MLLFLAWITYQTTIIIQLWFYWALHNISLLKTKWDRWKDTIFFGPPTTIQHSIQITDRYPQKILEETCFTDKDTRVTTTWFE